MNQVIVGDSNTRCTIAGWYMWKWKRNNKVGGKGIYWKDVGDLFVSEYFYCLIEVTEPEWPESVA